MVQPFKAQLELLRETDAQPTVLWGRQQLLQIEGQKTHVCSTCGEEKQLI